MLRDIDLKEVSDGKLYKAGDMVKADCQGCRGCSSCCRGMGSSIILDPLDIFRLTSGLSKSFEELLNGLLELNVVDGIILPNVRMTGRDEACVFLTASGRCAIHALRPGLCRLFPLGRVYEDHSFSYFLQIHECPNCGRAKVKVKKWLDTENFPRYEQFVLDWHYYLKERQDRAMHSDSAETIKQLSMDILRRFYIPAYDIGRDFYEQFYERMEGQL